MRPRAALALLLGASVATLSACGIDTRKEGTPPESVSRTPGETSTIDSEATKRLPKRPDGVVEVRGPFQGSLTPDAILGVRGVKVNYIGEGETEGIADLCAGRIDVLDTSRVLTAAERRVCARNGVELAAAIQIASDAVVIATPNESDVGGDCLRISTVNDIFRAGSPLTNWSQVGFFDIPLQVTGPRASSPVFQFFAQSALGVEANASLSDVRSDYRVKSSDNGVRFEVTSATRVRRVRRRYAQRIRDLTLERQLALQQAVDEAIADTRRRILDQFAREDARRAATEVTLSATQKALIARRNRRVITRALREAQARAVARFQFPRLTFLQARYRRDLRAARLKGTIGIFRFSYYELYEQQLRPMEIWDPDVAAETLRGFKGVTVVRDGDSAADGSSTGTTTSTTATATTPATATTTTTDDDGNIVVNADRTPWCVFPSQQTITNGAYPLSRRLMLYVSELNLRRPEVQTFLKSYLERAQRLASTSRLVPVPQDVLDRNAAIIELDKTPGVADTTSTTSTTGTTTTTTATTPQNVPGVGRGSSTTTTP